MTLSPIDRAHLRALGLAARRQAIAERHEAEMADRALERQAEERRRWRARAARRRAEAQAA